MDLYTTKGIIGSIERAPRSFDVTRTATEAVISRASLATADDGNYRILLLLNKPSGEVFTAMAVSQEAIPSFLNSLGITTMNAYDSDGSLFRTLGIDSFVQAVPFTDLERKFPYVAQLEGRSVLAISKSDLSDHRGTLEGLVFDYSLAQ